MALSVLLGARMSKPNFTCVKSVGIRAVISLIIVIWSIHLQAMQPEETAPYLPLSTSSEAQNWAVVNDTVMGGRSQARVSSGDTGLVFEGFLSLENNGGFASIRRYKEPVSWNPWKAINIRVIGDGKRYQFRIRTDRALDGVAYTANFDTVDNTQTDLSFVETDFTPVWRGRKVRGAPQLSFSDVRQLGFMLTDKQVGEFTLTILAIEQ